MLDALARFIYRNRRRVLAVALVVVAAAGALRAGRREAAQPVRRHRPSTQSVQATDRYEAATGHQIDPGVIALVTTGDVHSARAERRVRQVEAQLRASRDVATVSSYYDSHDPAVVAQDGRSSYVVAYFQARSDSRIQADAQRLESAFGGEHDVQLGGEAIASRRPTRRSVRTSRAPSCSRSR